MFLLPRWPDQSQMSCLKAFRVFLKCWPVPNTERNCASERWLKLKGKDRKNTKVLGKRGSLSFLMFYIPSMMNCSCFRIWSYNFHYQRHSLICPQQLSERSRDNSRTMRMLWPPGSWRGATRPCPSCPRLASDSWSWGLCPLPPLSAFFCQQIYKRI